MAKKRVKRLRTEKTTAALELAGGSSSAAETFWPLILPPRRAEMPGQGEDDGQGLKAKAKA